MSFSRNECLTRLREQVSSGRPIIGGGAGTGISAKCAEAGSIDLIIIYNSGRFRMAGRGSLSGMMPYGDANQIVVDMAREVLPVVQHTPVLAGVCGTDPFRIMKHFLGDLKAMGFSGVQNFPTVGLIDGTMRQGLEETGMGFDKEVEMIGQAPRNGFAHVPLCLHCDRSRSDGQGRGRRADPAHGSDNKRLDRRQVRADAGRSVHCACKSCTTRRRRINPEILVLCHGGPISEPADAAYVLKHTQGIVGFFGALSIERLPTETAITDCVRRFKAI